MNNRRNKQIRRNRNNVNLPKRKNKLKKNRNNTQRQGRTFDGLPSRMRNLPPQQITRNNQSRLIHREPLATLNGSVDFNITTYEINPGLANVFPWLSAQAAGYESYKFNSLTVEYRFTTNEFVGLGRVIIAPDYDASDDPPTSAVEAEQMADSIQGAVAKNWNCTLRPRGMGILGPKRYTRAGTLPANEDIKTYDIAQVHIITQGQSDTAEIGQLWLRYDVTLYEPQPIELGNIVSSGVYYNAAGTDCDTTDLLGTGVIEGTVEISHALNVVTLRNLIVGQTYLIALHLVATTLGTAPTITANTGLISRNSTDALLTLNGGTTNAWAFKYYEADDNIATLTLGGTTLTTAPSRAVLSVSASVTYS